MMLADVLAKSGEAAKSGPIGLAIILILCIGCYFLFKSMSKHLKKVREEFPAEPGTGEQPAAERTSTLIETPVQTPVETPDATGRQSAERPGE